jgi:coiled-coil domain-containing protein 77
MASERIAALLEDRRIRDEEEQAHRAHMNQQMEQAAQKLKRTEELLRQSTKDEILGRTCHSGPL